MKLAPDATAALTLGPQMGLNKLMQAALRMRQLARGQSVTLVATAEVARLVRERCGMEGDADVEARHVVQWVLHNTAEHNQRVRTALVSKFSTVQIKTLTRRAALKPHTSQTLYEPR